MSSTQNGTNNASSIREELVKQGVRFLQHPKVQDTPLSERLSFLERKGLTPQEIAKALKINDEQNEIRSQKAVESVTGAKSGERLKGRLGVVLGGNSGFGQLIALYLAKEQAKLVLVDVKQSNSKSTLQLLQEQQQQQQPATATTTTSMQLRELDDWQNVDALEDALQNAWKEFGGRLDFVINCIPIATCSSPLIKTKWEHLLGHESAARTTFVACRRSLHQMLQQEPNAHGIRGRIVNVVAPASEKSARASDAITLEQQLTFAINKAVIRQLTRHLADQFGRKTSHGIVFNAVQVKSTPSPDHALEVAHAVLFLISDTTRSIQGAQLVVV